MWMDPKEERTPKREREKRRKKKKEKLTLSRIGRSGIQTLQETLHTGRKGVARVSPIPTVDFHPVPLFLIVDDFV
jgi:predicted ThiF/HesA family dinucleotide-utilizing enzyme